MGVGDGALNEDVEFSTTSRTRTEYLGKELVGISIQGFILDSCIHATRISSEQRRENISCRQCWIPLQLNCRMTMWI